MRCHRALSVHYCDVIMSAIVSQITCVSIVYSNVYSDANQRKHQSSASLAFVRGIHWWPVNYPHKWPVTWKMFPFDDVIMILSDYRKRIRNNSLTMKLSKISQRTSIICYRKSHALNNLIPMIHKHNSSSPSFCVCVCVCGGGGGVFTYTCHNFNGDLVKRPFSWINRRWSWSLDK